MTADEHRERGNTAFRDGRFAEANDAYTAGLALQPNDVTLLRNRAASLQKLKRLPEALADAEKCVGLDASASNAKGFSRLGEIHWAIGTLDKAIEAYEKVLSLTPDNDTARKNLRQLMQEQTQETERLYGRSRTADTSYTPGGAGGSSGRATQQLWLDVITVALCIGHLLTMLFSPAISFQCWRAGLMSFGFRQWSNIADSLMAGGFSGMFGRLKSEFPRNPSFQYLLLCVLFWATSVPPQLLLFTSMAVYSLLLSAPTLRNGPSGGILSRVIGQNALIGPRLDEAISSSQFLRANAAMSEVMTGFAIFFSGASVIASMLYWQFLKFRYRQDTFVVHGFKALGDMVGKVAYHRMAPGIVGTGFTKFRAILHQLAVG